MELYVNSNQCNISYKYTKTLYPRVFVWEKVFVELNGDSLRGALLVLAQFVECLL